MTAFRRAEITLWDSGGYFGCHGYFRYSDYLGCLGNSQRAAQSHERILRDDVITQPDRWRRHLPPSIH
jgi:hypothetical protein